ncbi:MAG: hypothetical protein QMD21_00110 [Candidatus Thermoplasmatota archaeon]|nr:hypothetical protein [Candidatus Thermoplasmatota archaeon]
MKTALLAFVIISVTISISGCLDVHLGKELFGGKTFLPEINYKITDKASLEYTFTTIIPEQQTDEKQFTIIEGTYSLRIDIKVNIKTFPEIAELIPLTEIIAQQRYVTVSLDSPDGIYFNKTYRETAEESPLISSPTPGMWKLRVEASGIGYSGENVSYNDYYCTKASAREPL